MVVPVGWIGGVLMPTCARTRCGKDFEQTYRAPPKRYCSDGCRKRHPEELESARRHADGDIREPITQQDIVDAIRDWVMVYGAIPSARDWNPSQARSQGRDDIADRFYADNCWPWQYTVNRVFGTWSAAIRAAGYTPRRVGERGKAVPRIEAAA